MTLLLLLCLLALVPVGCVPLTRTLGRRAGVPVALLLLAAAALVLPQGADVLAGRTVEWSHPWVASLGVTLAFRLDGLGLVFVLLALVIGAVVFVFSARYLPDRANTGFYVVMTAFTYAMVALVLADDLVVLTDPKGALPPYDAVVMVSGKRAGDRRLMAALEPLIGKVSVEAMRTANYSVDRDSGKLSPAAAARVLEADLRLK